MSFLETLLKPLCLICEKIKKEDTGAAQGDMMRDRLTGLYSLSYFDEKLIHEHARFNRYEGPFSVIILKIDELNETPSRKEKKEWEAGIRHVGQIILSELRNVDVVARYTPISFIMLLPQTRILHARFVAERLRAVIKEKPMQWNGSEKALTVCLAVGEQIAKTDSDDILNRLNDKMKLICEQGADQVGIASDDSGDVPFEEEV